MDTEVIGARAQLSETNAKAQRKDIAELQAELDKHRWIRVGERLPKQKGWYWVCYGRYHPPTANRQLWGGKWEVGIVLGRQRDIDAITHWKEIILPELEAAIEKAKENKP